MIVKSSSDPLPSRMPTHLDLPDRGGAIVENSLELPQSTLLNEAMRPWLEKYIHPDRQYFIGADVGIYWKWTEGDPLRGCKSPDWYYVPGVPTLRDGVPRLSYVLWQEQVTPLILIEYVSGDGSEERDTTPMTGKFWVYEQRIQAEYYIIFDAFRDEKISAYQRIDGRYQPMKANARGHYEIPAMLAEIGTWEATYHNYPATWLRWFDLHGNMLSIGDERAEEAEQRAAIAKRHAEQEEEHADQERQRADREKEHADQERQRADRENQRAEQEKQRADKMAAKLRDLGIEPNGV